MRRVLNATILLLGTMSPCAEARVWFVNVAAVGNNDGSAWPNAFVDLQDALAVAGTGDEVWVAGGTYRPDRGTGDRGMSFVVPDGVTIYGGFAGWETSPGQRHLGEDETILSGDLAGDDGPHNCAEVSSCCVVHEGFGCDTPSCEASVCNLEPECCEEDPEHFEWDSHSAAAARSQCCALGGWNSCENSRIVVVASPGATGLTLDGITVSGAFGGPGWGYGVYVLGPRLTMQSCTVKDNQGYGVFSLTASLDITNCEFVDNIGIGLLQDQHSATVSHTCFLRNEAGFHANSEVRIDTCTFEDNLGRGIAVFDGDLAITDSRFVRNEQAVDHGWGSASYVGCEFLDNASYILEDGGVFRDCTFRGNLGGVSTAGGTSLINCLLSGHRSGVFIGGSFRLTNCTVANNAPSVFFISGIFNEKLTIDNSIFSSNSTPGLGSVGQQAGTIVAVNHSIVEGWNNDFPGVGTIDADPLFVDPLGPDGLPGTEDDDLRLSVDSPAVNTGAITPSVPAADLDSHPRVLCGQVDMGAYEFGTADTYCDGVIGYPEFYVFFDCLTGPNLDYPFGGICVSFDANTDGTIDLSDFAFLQRAFNSS